MTQISNVLGVMLAAALTVFSDSEYQLIEGLFSWSGAMNDAVARVEPTALRSPTAFRRESYKLAELP